MSTRTNDPAPHAREKEAPAIPRHGNTPGTGAPPQESGEPPQLGNEREPGTGPDGEALAPDAIDPEPGA